MKETVTFQYEKFWVAYRRQKPSGDFEKWNVRGWDRTRNRPVS